MISYLKNFFKPAIFDIWPSNLNLGCTRHSTIFWKAKINAIKNQSVRCLQTTSNQASRHSCSTSDSHCNLFFGTVPPCTLARLWREQVWNIVVKGSKAKSLLERRLHFPHRCYRRLQLWKETVTRTDALDSETNEVVLNVTDFFSVRNNIML